MIGGASWSWWIGFHVAVIVLLLVDWLLPGNRHDSRRTKWLSWLWTAFLGMAAGGFAVWIAQRQGHVPALQFVTGYAIELSLSIDNLFVFLVIFQGFRVNTQHQHEALTWGVVGAIVLRAVFIAAGVSLIHHFEWVVYVFGAILLWAGWRLVRGGSAHSAIPEWIRRMQKPNGSLLPVILAVEATDVLFAIDSIPAVLAVTRDPFIVYTSNIAAILGLRSLYFVLAGLLDRLRYLHYGLGALLIFVAFKMLAAKWIEVPITLSLAIIGGILAVCAVISLMVGPKKQGPGIRDQGTGNGREGT